MRPFSFVEELSYEGQEKRKEARCLAYMSFGAVANNYPRFRKSTRVCLC